MKNAISTVETVQNDCTVPAPCRAYLITSAKGGVGKTSVVCGLGCGLAGMGYRVLAVDMDLANRCLDLVCGVENRVVYHIGDIINGMDYHKAVIRDEVHKNLSYIAASQGMTLDAEGQRALTLVLEQIKQSGEYDYILLDTPGSFDPVLFCGAQVADCAIVISTEQQTAIRAADLTATVLESYGIPELRLIVNCFEPGHGKRKRQKKWVCLLEYVDTTRLRLLGVIPFEKRLWSLQNEGKLLWDRAYDKTDLRRAYQNITDRILGKNVPLGL